MKRQHLIFSLLLLMSAPAAHAVVTNACLINPSSAINFTSCQTNPTISGETVGVTSMTVLFQIDNAGGGGNIEIDIHRLQNVSDQPSADNLIAAIQQSGLSAPNPTNNFAFSWSGLWLVNGDIGRQDGNYVFIIT